jgi:DNA polymerase
MTMIGPFHPWRDTLLDLGVMGLIPEPAPQEPAGSVRAGSSMGQSTHDIEPEKTGLANAVPVRPVPPRPVPSAPASARPVAPTLSAPASARPVASAPVSARPVPPVPAGPSPTDPVAFPPPAAVAGAATLAELEGRIQGCLACPLGAGRIRFVFGEGGPESGLLFIGEGPGRDEDLKGRPFVGKAGELLDKMLGAIGLARSQVYIANIVKCRPPDNRTPSGAEAQTCLPYLKRQIELLRPRVIVTLGATPLRELLGVQTGITRVRGQWQQLDLLGGIPVMPTFHPAYVLRQYTQEVRRAVWSDLVAAKQWLDAPGAGPGRPGA